MRRIAAPVVGGLLTAMVLALIVIPVVYTLWREWQLRRGLFPSVVPEGRAGSAAPASERDGRSALPGRSAEPSGLRLRRDFRYLQELDASHPAASCGAAASRELPHAPRSIDRLPPLRSPLACRQTDLESGA
jgi:hypothetical protein